MEKKIQVLSSCKRLNHSRKSYGLDLNEYEFVEMVIERKKRTSITFIVEDEKDRTTYREKKKTKKDRNTTLGPYFGICIQIL
jgi:hypothetical protein